MLCPEGGLKAIRRLAALIAPRTRRPGNTRAFHPSALGWTEFLEHVDNLSLNDVLVVLVTSKKELVSSREVVSVLKAGQNVIR